MSSVLTEGFGEPSTTTIAVMAGARTVRPTRLIQPRLLRLVSVTGVVSGSDR